LRAFNERFEFLRGSSSSLELLECSRALMSSKELFNELLRAFELSLNKLLKAFISSQEPL